MLDFLNEVLMIDDLEPDAYQMGISGKSGAKVKAPDGGKASIKGDFNALHPRYPKGHPQGGKFMPKGSKDQIQAVAKAKGVSTEKAAELVGAKPSPNKGKLKKFSGSAGAVGKAQKVLRDKNATPEQRAKAKAIIAKAADKMRGEAPMADDKPNRGKISNKEIMARNTGESDNKTKTKAVAKRAPFSIPDDDEAEITRQKLAGRMPKDELTGQALKDAEKKLADRLSSINKGSKKAESDKPVEAKKVEPKVEEKPASKPIEKKAEANKEGKPESTTSKKENKPKKDVKPKIKNFDEFAESARQAAEKLNYEYNYDQAVPIYKLRRELGDRISKQQFDEFMLKLQGSKIAKLEGEDVEDNSKDKIADSVVSPINGVRTYVSFNKKLEAPKPQGKSKSKINTYERFEQEALKTALKIDEETKANNFIPIYKVRRAMGENLTRSEFNDWLIKMNSEGKVQLQESTVEDNQRSKLQDSVSVGANGIRAYMVLTEKGKKSLLKK